MTDDQVSLHPGHVPVGPAFGKPTRVETVRAADSGTVVVGLVRFQTGRVRRVTFSPGPDFLRLATALSALHPDGSEEERLLDAMLHTVPT